MHVYASLCVPLPVRESGLSPGNRACVMLGERLPGAPVGGEIVSPDCTPLEFWLWV